MVRLYFLDMVRNAIGRRVAGGSRTGRTAGVVLGFGFMFEVVGGIAVAAPAAAAERGCDAIG